VSIRRRHSGVTVYFELTGEDAYGNQFTFGPSQFTLTDSGFGDGINGNTIQFGQAGQRTISANLTGTTVHGSRTLASIASTARSSAVR
jgi:hypothetical protein